MGSVEGGEDSALAGVRGSGIFADRDGGAAAGGTQRRGIWHGERAPARMRRAARGGGARCGGPAGLGKGLRAAVASWRGGGEQSKRRRELKERGKSARSVSSVTSLNEAESGRCVSGVR